jgi:hypothetical protein
MILDCHVLKEILLISRAHDIASSLELMSNQHHAATSIVQQPATCSNQHHHSIMILDVMS